MEARLDATVPAGTLAVAPVKDPAAVQHDGLEEAVLAEVAHELAELGAVHLHEREESGGRVEVEGGEARCRSGVGPM